MALATRCPHCETVFKLDPHLLAPHDGRVRCGHCQEVFDAAHHRFELPGDTLAQDETRHAAIIDDDVAVGPSFSGPAASDSEADSDTKAVTPVRPLISTPVSPLLPVTLKVPVAPSPTSADPANPDYTASPSPAAPPQPTEAANEPARVKQFVRVSPPAPEEPPQRQPGSFAPSPRESEPPFVAPVDDRTEPFIGPVHREPEPEPAPPPMRTAPPPSHPWNDDAEPGFGAASAGGTHPASANEAFPVTREPRDAHASYASHDPHASHPPRDSYAAPAARSRRGWRVAGIVIAVLLALALIVQAAWWQRETVMVLVPGSRTLYASACDALGCTIAPPRDIDGLQIESSGLRQVDGPHKLELKLSLRNRLDVALAYPALELTLLDDKNNVAIRRVLWPQDYARPGTIFGIGLPPQSAQPVVVRLDTGDAVAANYRVQVFYP